MDGPTFQPPIHLDPNQDAAQQTSFINQNFQNLASTLESNSFRVVLTGNVSISGLADPYPSGTITTRTIPHNLQTVPAFLVYVANPDLSGTYYGAAGITNLPTTYYNLGPGATGGKAYLYSQARIDSTNLYIDLVNLLSAGITGLGGYTWAYTYYILQQLST